MPDKYRGDLGGDQREYESTMCDRYHGARRAYRPKVSSRRLKGTPMAIVMKATRSRLVRWFKNFTKGNKVAYRWYECDGAGL